MKNEIRPGVLAREIIEELGLHVCPRLKHFMCLTAENVLAPIHHDRIYQALLVRMGNDSTSAIMNDAMYQIKYLATVYGDSGFCSCKARPGKHPGPQSHP